MALQLTDLDELVQNVRNRHSKKYIDEALTSYRAGAQRAAIITIWVAVCVDIIEKIKELNVSGDKYAKELEQEINGIDPNDYPKMMRFEKDILAIACDKLEMITAIERDHLERLKQDRNICAHPNFSIDGSHFAPAPELTRSYIVQACQYLLTNQPVKGKVVIDRIFELIISNTFPVAPEKAFVVLSSDNNLGRVRESVIRNLTILLLKRIFKDDESIDQNVMKRICASLQSICRIDSNTYNTILSEKLSSFISETNEVRFLRLFPVTHLINDIWKFISESERVRLETAIKAMSPSNIVKYNLPDLSHKYGWINSLFQSRFNELTVDDKYKIIKSTPSVTLKKHAIETFINSGNFEQTSQNSIEILLPHVRFFDDHDLESLLQGMKTNNSSWGINQIMESNCIRKVVYQLYRETKPNIVRHAEIWIKFWNDFDDINRKWFVEFKELLVADGLIQESKTDEVFMPPPPPFPEEVPF